MQRIEEKRIDNSSLVPSRIAEQKTTWRQPKPLGIDMSGMSSAFNALGRLADSVSREFEKADREMDELAQIKANALFSAEQQAAFNKLEGMPLTEIENNLDKIRGDFTANVRKKLEAIPMTDRMREVVNANLLGADEKMKLKLQYEFERKRAKYIVDENIFLFDQAMRNGNTKDALDKRKKLYELGIFVKYSEADIKSNGTFKALQESFDLNNFEYLDKLSANKDGKYTHFKELKHDDRMKLIKYGKERQSILQDSNYNKYLNMNTKGEYFTVAAVEKMHESGGLSSAGYRSLVKVRQQTTYEDLVNSFVNIISENELNSQKDGINAMIQNEYDNKNLSEKQYTDLNIHIKKGTINQLKMQIEEKNKNAGLIKSAFLGKIKNSAISLMPFENNEQKIKALDEAKKIFSAAPEILAKVNEEIEKIYADGLKGKGIFDTPQGANFKKWFDSQYRIKDKGIFNADKLQYDPIGKGDWDSEDFIAYRGYELLQYGSDLLAAGLDENSVKNLVEEKYESMTKDRAKEIMKKLEERNKQIFQARKKGE